MRRRAPAALAAGFGALSLALSATLPAGAAPTLSPVVVETHPHDTGAFTEGLLLHDGFLFESTGLEGRSSLRRVDRTTGQVLQSIELPAVEFGEGLALAGDQLIQLTYRNGLAHVYDRASFAALRTFEYDGEGWGLCYDGSRLIMSDGSDRLTFRDPNTFAITGSVSVQENGVAFRRLNELECVGGEVFANVWLTDLILRIDPETGDVLSKVDAGGLLSPAEAVGVDVLNGIAHDPISGRFLLTGKFWPKLFEVTLGIDTPEAVASAQEPSCALARAFPGAREPWPLLAVLIMALRGRRARARR